LIVKYDITSFLKTTTNFIPKNIILPGNICQGHWWWIPWSTYLLSLYWKVNISINSHICLCIL